MKDEVMITDLENGDIIEAVLTSGWTGVRYFRGWEPVNRLGLGGCALISATKNGPRDKMPPGNFVSIRLLSRDGES